MNSEYETPPPSRPSCLVSGLILPLFPYTVCPNREGSGNTLHMCRFDLVFTGHFYNVQKSTRPPVGNRKLVFLFLNQNIYVVGSQKNHLDETVLLSTQNTCLNGWPRKESHFKLKKFTILDL